MIMIKYKSKYIRQIQTLFGEDELRQLDNMNHIERKRYYYHLYSNGNRSLCPTIWLFRSREKYWYMTHSEIAEKLNLSVPIVKTAERNALKKIYQYFKSRGITLEDLL